MYTEVYIYLNGKPLFWVTARWICHFLRFTTTLQVSMGSPYSEGKQDVKVLRREQSKAHFHLEFRELEYFLLLSRLEVSPIP